MSRTHRMNCPGCDETGSFVEEYAEWKESPTVLGSGIPDYDTQLMECREDDCDVHHYLPGDKEEEDA